MLDTLPTETISEQVCDDCLSQPFSAHPSACLAVGSVKKSRLLLQELELC